MKFYPPSWNDGVKARLLVVLGFSVTEVIVWPTPDMREHIRRIIHDGIATRYLALKNPD